MLLICSHPTAEGVLIHIFVDNLGDARVLPFNTDLGKMVESLRL